jgi:hypothetical protein
MRFNYNQNTNGNINAETLSNITKAFLAIRPVITNKGDRLQVDHINSSYTIPITRYQSIKTVQLR